MVAPGHGVAQGEVAAVPSASSTAPTVESVTSEGPRRVVGRVLEEGLTDTGVPGATVQVVGDEPADSATAMTDADGRFLITNMPAGARWIHVSAPYYAPRTFSLSSFETRPAVGSHEVDEWAVEVSLVWADDVGTDALGSAQEAGAPGMTGNLLASPVAPSSDWDLSRDTGSAGGEDANAPTDGSGVDSDEPAYGATATTVRTTPDAASTVRLSARELNAAPRRNAEELLRQVPGLTLVQHGSEGKGHQFFLRGFDASHGADLALSVNGVPINEWSNVHAQGYLDLGLVIPEMVDRVAATKGPFTLTQGAFAMAGSADYRLGVGREDRGLRASYTVGTTNRHRVFVGFSPRSGEGADGEQLLGVEATHDDGYGDGRSLRRATVNGQVRLLDSRSGGSLRLFALGGFAEFALPGTLRNDDVDAGLVDFYGTRDPAGEGQSARAVLGLAYEWAREQHSLRVTAYGGHRRLNLRENFTGFLLDPENGDRRGQAQQTWSFGTDVDHLTELGSTIALRTGMGVRGDVFAQQEDQLGRSLEVVAPRRDLQGTQLLLHSRLGVRWTPVDALRVDAGVRLDWMRVRVGDALDPTEDGARRVGRGGDLAVSPRLTAQWRVTERAQLFVAYGRGVRPPEARAFTAFDPGRPGIGEERMQVGEGPSITASDAIELGLRWAPIPQLQVTASAFGTFIAKESIFDHVSGVSLELNGTRRLGGELVVEARPVPWLMLRADVTAVDARFSESGRRVPFAPWLVAGMQGVVTHPSGFSAGLRVLTVAPRPLPHGATGSTLVRTDATLGYRWRWLRVGLEVENLLGLELREGEYHYASHWRQGEPASELPALHTSAGAPLNARLTVGIVY